MRTTKVRGGSRGYQRVIHTLRCAVILQGQRAMETKGVERGGPGGRHRPLGRNESDEQTVKVTQNSGIVLDTSAMSLGRGLRVTY